MKRKTAEIIIVGARFFLHFCRVQKWRSEKELFNSGIYFSGGISFVAANKWPMFIFLYGRYFILGRNEKK